MAKWKILCQPNCGIMSVGYNLRLDKCGCFKKDYIFANKSFNQNIFPRKLVTDFPKRLHRCTFLLIWRKTGDLQFFLFSFADFYLTMLLIQSESEKVPNCIWTPLHHSFARIESKTRKQCVSNMFETKTQKSRQKLYMKYVRFHKACFNGMYALC